MDKVLVNDAMLSSGKADPIFVKLKEAAGITKVGWNFSKFLVNRSGTVVKFYPSSVEPFDMEKDIVEMLNESDSSSKSS